MTFRHIQCSFVSGEMDPRLLGRTDLAKYRNGAFTMRNFYASYRGGASSRAGLAYVGTCKQSTSLPPPRDINFQFSLTQGYVLEFGELYLRIKTSGGYILERTQPITAITQANPGVFTYTNTHYALADGDWVYVTAATGMTNFNGLTWIVYNSTPTTFSLKDLFGNPVDTSAFSAYTGSGLLQRVYTVTSPYASVDLPYLKYTQSADTMTLTCVNTSTLTEYPPYDLIRHGQTNWTFTLNAFGSDISAPTGLTVAAQSSSTPTTYYSYVVTAVDRKTGEESIASDIGSIQNNDISIYAGTNSLTWVQVEGAASYNVYRAPASYGVGVPVSSIFGFLGTALGPSFTDNNITPDYTVVPPVHTDPFARSQVTDVIVTAGGVNYSQDTISFVVTTSTGTGFDGLPVVAQGSLVGFLITNPGFGYDPADTIAFSDSGGGVATGGYAVAANPADGDFVTLNGVQVKWRTPTASLGGHEIELGHTAALSIQSLAIFLNSTPDVNLNKAVYTFDDTNLYIKYKTSGVDGNSYSLSNGPAGWTRTGATLTGGGTIGSGATATLTIGDATGTYPGVCAYYQQRRVYAATLNDPDTYYMTQPGLYHNMDASIPVTPSDAITGTPWAQQINAIQFMVPMPGGLVVLTGSGAWQVNGGNSSAISPSNQTATPQAYNGVNNIVPPIPILSDILYLQAKQTTPRDLSYNFFNNIYTGSDLSILSGHLFDNHTIVQWAYAEEPFKFLWAVRDDGQCLCLTYLKDQDVYAWSRHDTNGLFVSACSVTEPPVDALYFITKRFVRGAWWYYAERMANRNWENAEESLCLDSYAQYPLTYPAATLSPFSATGDQNISDVTVVLGGANYTAPVVTAIDPLNLGSGARFSVALSGGAITGITVTHEGQGYSDGTELLIQDATGSGALAQPIITNIVQFNASAAVFAPENVGDVLRVDGGKATIVNYIGNRRVEANITVPLSQTVPNDPENTPLPATSGSWSMTTPVSTVTGLNHLEGLQVVALADGNVQKDLTVTNGAITLEQPASLITVGLPYTCQLQTTYLDPEGPGTEQGAKKNIYMVTARMDMSRGWEVGTNQPDQSMQPNHLAIPWTGLVPPKERNATVHAGDAIPLYTGDTRVTVGGGWDTRGQAAFQTDNPLPVNVLAVVCWVVPGDTSG